MKVQGKSVIAVMLVCLFAAIPVSAQTLYIFYPSTTRPSVVQQQISDSCGNDVKVTAFGRFPDFKEKTETDRPDFIITKPLVLEQIPGYSVRLKGLRNGRSEEPCVLLSIDKGVDLDSISGITIGAVDFLGRAGMEKYIAGRFRQPVRLNRVIKIEDLLPMLIFNKAQAVFTGEGNIKYFRKTTTLKLAVTEVPDCRSGIIVCASRSDKDDSSTGAVLDNISKKTKTLLEIDQWKQEK